MSFTDKLRAGCYTVSAIVLMILIGKGSVTLIDWFLYRDADDLPYETVDKPVTKDQINKKFKRLPESQLEPSVSQHLEVSKTSEPGQ